MTTHSTAIDHPCRRLTVALPRLYDEARERYETLVPEVDVARFVQMASWMFRHDPPVMPHAPFGPSCTSTSTATPNSPSTNPACCSPATTTLRSPTSAASSTPSSPG